MTHILNIMCLKCRFKIFKASLYENACGVINCDFHFTAVLLLVFFTLVCWKIAPVANVICLRKPTLNKVSCILYLGPDQYLNCLKL